MSLTASDLYSLHSRTPHELVTGFTPDISEFIDHTWYDPLWFYTDVNFPQNKRELGRWLGIAHRVGQALCYWKLSNKDSN